MYLCSGTVLVPGFQRSPGLIVRVGEKHNPYANRDGHGDNVICASFSKDILTEAESADLHVTCKQPVAGQWLSVEPFLKEGPAFKFGLCDLKVF